MSRTKHQDPEVRSEDTSPGRKQLAVGCGWTNTRLQAAQLSVSGLNHLGGRERLLLPGILFVQHCPAFWGLGRVVPQVA